MSLPGSGVDMTTLMSQHPVLGAIPPAFFLRASERYVWYFCEKQQRNTRLKLSIMTVVLNYC